MIHFKMLQIGISRSFLGFFENFRGQNYGNGYYTIIAHFVPVESAVSGTSFSRGLNCDGLVSRLDSGSHGHLQLYVTETGQNS